MMRLGQYLSVGKAKKGEFGDKASEWHILPRKHQHVYVEGLKRWVENEL